MKARISPCACGNNATCLCAGGGGVYVYCAACGELGLSFTREIKNVDNIAIRSWNKRRRSDSLREWLKRHPRINHCYALKWIYFQWCRIVWWMQDFVRELKWRVLVAPKLRRENDQDE